MVLLASGPMRSGEAREASAAFAVRPAALKLLFGVLGIQTIKNLPPFEVLLEITSREGAPTDSRIIAWRKYPRPAAQ